MYATYKCLRLRLRGKGIIYAVKGDAFHPAVIALKPVSGGVTHYSINAEPATYAVSRVAATTTRTRTFNAEP